MSWTCEEKDILVENYRRLKFDAVCELLPDRTPLSIRRYARVLLLSCNPTEEEWMKAIRENPGRKAKYYADLLGACLRTAKVKVKRYREVKSEK